MGLETGSTIASLITSNPTSGDPVSQGDDHIRLIKSVLQTQFPGSGGLGYSIPITTTESELNALHGFTNVGFVSGTRMPFAQPTAPTGWTQDITDNATNRMLRVVNTTGNSVGGTDSPILNNTSIPGHTHTFTGNALPTHTHTDSGHNHSYNTKLTTYPQSGNSTQVWYGSADAVTGTGFANISSVSAGTPSGTNANNTAVSWTPRYIDMIICTKN